MTACIIMHNMMVEKRVEDGESESEGFYEIAICSNQDGNNEIVDGMHDEIENHDAKVMHRMRVLEAHHVAGQTIADNGIKERFHHMQFLPQCLRVIEQ